MIIYLVTNTYFNNRDKERFGIDFFLNKNYKVVVLDIQDYSDPELNHFERPTYTSHPNLEVILCSDLKTIKTSVKKLGAGIAFLFLPDDYKGLKIKKYLQQNSVKIGILHAGMLPSVHINQSLTLKILNKFKKLSLKNFIELIVDRFYSKIFNIKYYDFLITSNYNTSLLNYSFPKPLDIIETHCFDYDLILKYKNSKNMINGKYIVFLDQYLLNHSDFLRTNSKLNIHEDRYYKELNIFFKQIEEKFNYKVVIAAHPRADIRNYKKIFNGRDIIYGKSALLVKHSEFVLTHYSTAMNFAIIYKKPIVFITNNDLEKSDMNFYIQEFSALLNQTYINISSSKNLSLDIKIDSNKYNDYKEKYIKNNNIEEFSYEIFDNSYLKSVDFGR